MEVGEINSGFKVKRGVSFKKLGKFYNQDFHVVELKNVLKPSNSSTSGPDEINSDAGKPHRVLGHPFSSKQNFYKPRFIGISYDIPTQEVG
ncbi:hypothetical protein CEXT_304101 [Caerostris extrusa]|uniref:Uncharacterized protein n=1 Tax=Caerostris extrusa TaxID=172846 RepID=A0AAV4MF38_CAEEX|nr:hypothetical protein CEXT_304101 [Caerostris extrusa]